VESSLRTLALTFGTARWVEPNDLLMQRNQLSVHVQQIEFGWAVKYEVGPEQNNLRRSKKQ
jgi:hypothetical protein